jgi:hypothetical protein
MVIALAVSRSSSSWLLDPVTGKPLETSQLIKLNFFKVS